MSNPHKQNDAVGIKGDNEEYSSDNYVKGVCFVVYFLLYSYDFVVSVT